MKNTKEVVTQMLTDLIESNTGLKCVAKNSYEDTVWVEVYAGEHLAGSMCMYSAYGFWHVNKHKFAGCFEMFDDKNCCSFLEKELLDFKNTLNDME